jgi:hypothetical protein
MNTVWVVAKLRPGCDDPDEAVGVWEVSLAQSMEPDIAAGAALDIFHGRVAISVLDDFEISTIDPMSQNEIFESEAYKRGSSSHGSIKRIAVTSRPPRRRVV